MDAHAQPPAAHFVALGTRGDVEPCLHLAAALAARPGAPVSVALATHTAHRGWAAPLGARDGIALEWLPALPAGQWEGGREADPAAAQRALEAAVVAFLRHQPRLSSTLGSQPAPHTTVFFNLFALEAWHVAEALALPAVALAPYPMPRSAPPPGLAGWLVREHPALATSLRCAGGCAPPEAMAGGAGVDTGVSPPNDGGACWCSLRAWQFPLLNEARWAPLRASLGLPPLPFSTPELRRRPTARTPLLYGFSEAVLPAGFPAGGGGGSSGCEPWLPVDAFCARARAAVAITGYWRAPLRVPAPPSSSTRRRPPLLAVSFGSMLSLGTIAGAGELGTLLGNVAAACTRVGALAVAVVPSGLPPGLETLRLGSGAVARVWREGDDATSAAIAQQGPWDDDSSTAGSLEACWAPFAAWLRSYVHGGSAAYPTAAAPPVFVYAGPVPFDWLFPRVDAVLHHGGSGTTAAALHAGVPQLVAPLIFDQHTWADAVAAAGVSPPGGAPLPSWELLEEGSPAAVDSLADALRRALPPPLGGGDGGGNSDRHSAGVESPAPAGTSCCRAAATALAARLAGEDGAAAALAVVADRWGRQSE